MLYGIQDHNYYFTLIVNGFRQDVKSISIKYNVSTVLVWDKLEEYHGYIDKKLFTICFYSKDSAFKFIEFLQTLEIANQLSK